jgi:hypothetical protein
MKEDVIDPIRQFMSGTNKGIYDEAKRFLQQQNPNFSAMDSEKPAQLKAILEAPDCYMGNKMKDAKALVGELKKDVEKHIKKTREDTLAHVSSLQQRVQGMQEYSALQDEQKKEIENSFHAIQNYIQQENLISSIRDRAGRYEANEYNSLLTKITEWTQEPTETPVELVSQSELGVRFNKPILNNEDDVNEYLEAIRKAMLKAIKGNKRIRL